MTNLFMSELSSSQKDEFTAIINLVEKIYQDKAKNLKEILADDCLPLLEEIQEWLDPDQSQEEAELDHTLEQTIERITNLLK